MTAPADAIALVVTDREAGLHRVELRGSPVPAGRPLLAATDWHPTVHAAVVQGLALPWCRDRWLGRRAEPAL